MRTSVVATVTALAALASWPTALPAQRTVASDVVWPLPPEAPRIRYVGLVRTEWDIGRSLSLLARLKQTLLGIRPDFAAVQRPHDVYADSEHRIYVSDGVYGKVLLFDPGARRARVLGANGPGILSKPLGLGGDGRGVYVADAGARRVVAFGPDGEFVRAYGGREVLLNPTDVAVDAARGRVYVVDSYLHQIVVFDLTSGAVLARVGKAAGVLGDKADMGRWGSGKNRSAELRDLVENRGSAPGEFRYPGFIAVAGDGTVYVADQMNFRVQVFDPSLRFIRQIGRNGDVPGSFARPKGLGVDSQGHVYVVDAAFANIQVFDRGGELLLAFAGMGRGDGELFLPLGLHVDGEDRVYVADRQNRRIQIYQYTPVMVAPPPIAGAVPLRTRAGGYQVEFLTTPAGVNAGSEAAVQFRIVQTSAQPPQPVSGLKAMIRCIEPGGVFEDHEVQGGRDGVYQAAHVFPVTGSAVATVTFTGLDGLPASVTVQFTIDRAPGVLPTLGAGSGL